VTARTKKIARAALISLASLLAVAIAAGLFIIRTAWFADFVRTRVVEEIEDSTGGKTEIGAFHFDWPHWRAEIHNFVLHGTEPSGSAPLFRADSIEAQLRTSALWKKHELQLQSLTIERPQINVMVRPNGTTNVPEPNAKRESNTNGLKTIVDLAIGRFRLDNGSVRFADREMQLSATGENLTAQLYYSVLGDRYNGRISMSPLFLQSGNNPQLNVDVDLPVVLGRDHIAFDSATLSTAASRIQVTGSMDHLASPVVTARASGQFNLPELNRALGSKLPVSAAKNVPQVAYLDAAINAETEGGRISHARLTLGRSSVDVSGLFQDWAGLKGSVHFDGNLDAAELARTFKLGQNVGGALQVAGNANLNGAANYSLTADLNGRGLHYRDGNINVSNVALRSIVAADPHTVRATALHAAWLGGVLDANATLQDFERYRVDGSVRRFDLRQLAQVFTSQNIGYAGTLSGTINTRGELKAGVETASARIVIAPAAGGVPVRGQINAAYHAGSVDLGQSFIALPSSRLDLNGNLGQQIGVRLVSRNFDDLRPITPDLSVRFDPGGSAMVDGVVTGRLNSPAISGHAALSRFAVEQRHFDTLAADFDARSTGAGIRNATLSRGALNAQIQASVGFTQWKTTPSSPVQASVAIRNADVMDLLALAQQKTVPVRGGITVSAQATGTIGDPHGSADVMMANGEAYGQPIDELNGRVAFGGQEVTIPALQARSGQSRVNASATFQHPLNDFSTGTLRAHVDGDQVTLSRLAPVHQRRPDLDGEVQLKLDAEAALQAPAAAERVRLISLNGNIGAKMVRLRGENLGDLTATVQTNGNLVSYRLDSDFAGASIRADGRTNLAADYDTAATLNVRNLPVEKALAVAGQQTIPARGVLAVNGQVSGTWRDPRASVDINVARGLYDKQAFEIAGHLDYSNTLVDVQSFSARAGSNRMTMNASFSHPANDFSTGNVRLQLDTNTMQLADLSYIQQLRPGLAGSFQANIDGAAALTNSPAEPRLMFSRLNGKIVANGLRANGKDLGALTAVAEQGGNAVRVTLDSNLAQSSIHVDGQAQLTRDYPLTAQVNFSNVRYSNFSNLLGQAGLNTVPGFDALLEGSANVTGPAMAPANLTGSAQISRLEMTSTQRGPAGRPAALAFHNDGPISLVANQSGIQVQRAHIVGPSTDIAVTGNMAIRPGAAFNVNVNATTDLSLLQQISKNTSSGGAVSLKAAITGSPSQPVINGRLELKNAAYQQFDWPNGISKANGAIVFTGTTARFESLSAESGGGRITATGNVTRTGSGFFFNLQSRANRVLVVTPDGVSLTANGNIRLTGTTQSSVVGGDITIVNARFNPRIDAASLLMRTAEPAETPDASEGFLANMNLDVAVRMAPGATFQSTYTQGLQAQADLKLRGSMLSPGMIGRVNLTQGNVVLFGTKYTINEGNITFYNPYKIEPVLDLSLETTVQSVNVVLSVKGPVENMNLEYHSDPPLQFSEIIALLGAGKTPTSDPVLVANQPPVPQQSLTDQGASALLGATVANPVAGQLQRVFGVSQLNIAPTFVTGSTLPQARVTLQQQVADNVTFTYVTDLSQPDSQILRVEWAINPRWSAVASREINGLVGVDVFYKKRFR
jgi:translocation and assembly module TamB